MLRYKLLWERDNEVAYEYYPEGGLEAGVIIYDTHSKEFVLEKPAQNDAARTYAGMMATRIREFPKTNGFKQDGIVAWC